jgi:hypothetical protein
MFRKKETWEPQTDRITPLDLGAFLFALGFGARENRAQT